MFCLATAQQFSMLEDVGETLANISLAQSIQNGLPSSQSIEPEWADDATFSAKQVALRSAMGWEEFQQPLCRFIMAAWSEKEKQSLSSRCNAWQRLGIAHLGTTTRGAVQTVMSRCSRNGELRWR